DSMQIWALRASISAWTSQMPPPIRMMAPISRAMFALRRSVSFSGGSCCGSVMRHDVMRYDAIVSLTLATSVLSSNGFGKEGELFFRLVGGERLLGVARHEDDLEVGLAPPQLLEQRRPVHLGHHHVGHHEVDLALVLVEHLDRLDTVAGLQHRVAARREPAR